MVKIDSVKFALIFPYFNVSFLVKKNIKPITKKRIIDKYIAIEPTL